MKKILLVFLVCTLVATMPTSRLLAQSVAINTDSSAADPSAILDLKSTGKGFLVPRMTMAQRNAITSPASSLLIFQTDSTAGYYYYNGTAWLPLQSSTTTGGGSDTLWKANGTNIISNGSGYVGIGTSTPAFPLTLRTATGAYGFTQTDDSVNLTTIVGPEYYLNGGKTAKGGWIGTQSNYPFYLFANGGRPAVTISPNGYVGIGNENPDAMFTVGKFTGIPNEEPAGGEFAIENQQDFLQISTGNNLTVLFSSNDLWLSPASGGGHVLIDGGASLPANTLQVGDMGLGGYNGNDFAIGEGDQDFGIAQMDDETQISSTTNIVFMPRTGRIGINTASPQAALEVHNNYSITPLSNAETDYFETSDFDGPLTSNTPGPLYPGVSILATGEVYASDFAAYSDQRIKNLIGTSNANKDLAAINAIRIRDYTMKDKMKYGNRHFKKVIAQEVEQVDPDLVSKHSDFIPNVYQVADRVTKTTNGYLLHFRNDHHLGDTAKALEAITSGSGDLQPYNIISIPSSREVVIDAAAIKTNHVFVYGEQVPDMRTVDYDGLTTLNVSATQELGRQVKDLQLALAAANKNILILAQKVREISKSTTHLTAHKNDAPLPSKHVKKIVGRS